MTWWRDSHLIDSSFEGTYKQTVQNTLSIPNISKDDLLAELTCSASNNNITMPVKTSVTIEMKCEHFGEWKLDIYIISYFLPHVFQLSFKNVFLFSSTKRSVNYKQARTIVGRQIILARVQDLWISTPCNHNVVER